MTPGRRPARLFGFRSFLVRARSRAPGRRPIRVRNGSHALPPARPSPPLALALPVGAVAAGPGDDLGAERGGGEELGGAADRVGRAGADHGPRRRVVQARRRPHPRRAARRDRRARQAARGAARSHPARHDARARRPARRRGGAAPVGTRDPARGARRRARADRHARDGDDRPAARAARQPSDRQREPRARAERAGVARRGRILAREAPPRRPGADRRSPRHGGHLLRVGARDVGTAGRRARAALRRLPLRLLRDLGEGADALERDALREARSPSRAASTAPASSGGSSRPSRSTAHRRSPVCSRGARRTR